MRLTSNEIALMSFLFMVVGACIGLIIRTTLKWGKIEGRLEAIASNLKDLVVEKDKTHEAMLKAMAEDRRATNERLTWLERNLWAKRLGE
jgi:hypothetical protein